LCGRWELQCPGEEGVVELHPDGRCYSATGWTAYEGRWSVRDGCLFCDEVMVNTGTHFVSKYPLWAVAHNKFHAQYFLSINNSPPGLGGWFTLTKVGQ
jgi:hypothetical protein